MSRDENLPAVQVSHFNSTACLNVFLSSFLNSYVHKLPTERRQGEMNERNGGLVVWRGWKLGHEGEGRETELWISDLLMVKSRSLQAPGALVVKKF